MCEPSDQYNGIIYLGSGFELHIVYCYCHYVHLCMAFGYNTCSLIDPGQQLSAEKVTCCIETFGHQ